MLAACIDVSPDPDQIAAVRAFVVATLRDWDMVDRTDDAVLVASELATNAVLHARTGYRVTLQAPYSGLLRIEVSDENPRPPAPAPDEPGATSGRGLHVVAGLAATWGSESSALGKVVWAELGDRQVTDPECYDLRDVDSTEDALAQIDRRRSDSSAR